MKLVIAAVAALTMSSIASAGEVPSGYQLKCDDGTYMYNRLEIKESIGYLNFDSSGYSATFISVLPPMTSYSVYMTASFRIPLEDCSVSAADPKLMACHLSELNIDIQSQPNSSPEIKERVALKHVVVQTRKVTEVSALGDEVSGYELVITGTDEGRPLVYTQRFYNETDGLHSPRCFLK